MQMQQLQQNFQHSLNINIPNIKVEVAPELLAATIASNTVHYPQQWANTE